MKVYFSHTGIDNWKTEIEMSKVNTIEKLIENLNDIDNYIGIKNTIIESGKISSCARIFGNIEVLETPNNPDYIKFYENMETLEYSSINDVINENVNNILIAVFDAQRLIELLNKSMSVSSKRFKFKDENGNLAEKDFKPMIKEIKFETKVKEQVLYEFNGGHTTLKSLEYASNEKPIITFDMEKPIKERSKILPSDLIEAIRTIWTLEKGEGSLRLFQEDALFFIMAKLLKYENIKEKHLLLSMPTGGGKTEAFMIPLLSYIYQKKKEHDNKRIKAIVIYPTNALANDQAMRFVELIYVINEQLAKQGIPSTKMLSIGILSGDTPSKNANLERESLIQICPKCGKTKWIRERDTLVCADTLCNTRLDFCRLTKDSIIENPPDILITNPDEINISLHNPRVAPLFYNKIDAIVFDEVHVYQGIFGCNVSHLLRRLEEISENKPLYIGMSATIGNAKELAALVFNEKVEDILYINDNNGYYTNKNKPSKLRHHLILKPALLGKNKNFDDSEKKRYVRTMSVAGAVGMFIGHLITDSHFRKSIVFTNYRAEADDLATYTRERERLDVDLYFKNIMNKIKRNDCLTMEETEICQYMFQWFDSIYSALGSINSSVNIGWNRGGLEKETRIRSVHSFSRNKLLTDDSDKYPIDLMVATKTLEVGIDIGDVTTVINASAPFTANEYVQRVGRGGRKKDSLAITIINPENAIDAYFSKHFNDYVEAKQEYFEDAPIILNNDIIIERHIKARLLDYIVKQLYIYDDVIWDIKFFDISEKLKFQRDGYCIEIGPGKTNEDAIKYADCIYEDVFDKTITGAKIVDRFKTFLINETLILNTNVSAINPDLIREWYREIIKQINTNLQIGSKSKWELSERAIGYNGRLNYLTPTLRGSGATVSLHIGNNETPTDTVSRQTAFNQMPPATDSEQVVTIHSGVSTFKIDDIYKETDKTAEKKIKILMNKDNNANIREYFYKKIDRFPDIDDVEDFRATFSVQVQNALQVSYFPSRFYCSSCHKGLIGGSDLSEVMEKKDGIYCKRCNNKVTQLHKVYFCKDCSSVYDPPIPKVCLNPDCSDYRMFYDKYSRNGHRINNEMLEHFKFRLTKDLEWVCEKCGCKMNFSSSKRMHITNQKKYNFTGNVVGKWQENDTSTGVAVKFKKAPELFKSPKNRVSIFSCKKNREHKNIDTIGIPRVRTVAYSYIGSMKENQEGLCSSISNKSVQLDFEKGYVLQLANEFMRRYTSGGYGSQNYIIKTQNIYEQTNCLGNYYESHLAWIEFSESINDFIKEEKYKCNGDCSICKEFEKLDLGDTMKPRLELENYNFDKTTGKPKKPDYRGKFCLKAQKNECKSLSCKECNDVDRNEFKNEFLKYLIVHTIKHSLLWAMPKYAGVNISEIRGEVYPNDKENGKDLVLIDSNEGGSGAIILIQKHWKQIWDFSEEILNFTCNNEANIILPYTCSRNNADLCPFIAKEYIEYTKML